MAAAATRTVPPGSVSVRVAPLMSALPNGSLATARTYTLLLRA